MSWWNWKLLTAWHCPDYKTTQPLENIHLHKKVLLWSPYGISVALLQSCRVHHVQSLPGFIKVEKLVDPSFIGQSNVFPRIPSGKWREVMDSTWPNPGTPIALHPTLRCTNNQTIVLSSAPNTLGYKYKVESCSVSLFYCQWILCLTVGEMRVKGCNHAFPL